MIARMSLHRFTLPAVLLLVCAIASCQGGGGSGTIADGEEPAPTIRLTSPVFDVGQEIPERNTCDADDLSPPLAWSGVPPATRTLALICDDPDAPSGDWVHWVLYGLPPTEVELPEGVDTTAVVFAATRQGTNDFGRSGYGGPCPPPGKPHRYYFRLYALDAMPDLGPGATKRQLLDAIEGHVLARGELMGQYRRK